MQPRPRTTLPAPWGGDAPPVSSTKVILPTRRETLLGLAEASEPHGESPRLESGERKQVQSGGMHRAQSPSVDEVCVSSRTISVRRPVEPTPRVVDRASIARAPLEPREAFVVGLIDGTLTVSDLVDVSGVPEAELGAILSRLARLGIIKM